MMKEKVIVEELNRMYNDVADELNISDSVYESAKRSYEELGEYLSNHIKYEVDVYRQGSMSIGTTIKPVSDKDDYDLDAVCQIDSSFEEASALKNIVGDVLKKSKRYSILLDKEGKRCWTLNYKSKNFHLDVLPATPYEIHTTRVRITNKDLKTNTYEFRLSDPKGYAEWFLNKQRKVHDNLLAEYREQYKDSVESLKEYKVRTPLQKTVQLLKRHRDIKYKDASDKRKKEKPISIIITTLVAKMYTGEENIYQLLRKFVCDYKKYIDVDSEGNFVISNPVNPQENFADKWKEYPERKDAFFKWVESAKKELIDNNFLKTEERIEQANYLKTIFGDSTITNVYFNNTNRYKDGKTKCINHDSLATLSNHPTDMEVKKHTFYGIKISKKKKELGRAIQ